jgi:hypothetical protein
MWPCVCGMIGSKNIHVCQAPPHHHQQVFQAQNQRQKWLTYQPLSLHALSLPHYGVSSTSYPSHHSPYPAPRKLHHKPTYQSSSICSTNLTWTLSVQYATNMESTPSYATARIAFINPAYRNGQTAARPHVLYVDHRSIKPTQCT